MEEARPSDRELSINQRESDLKIQLEQVHVALQQLRQSQESMHGLETRLADMTETTERVENALKLTNDVYLARIYLDSFTEPFYCILILPALLID